MLLKWRKAEAKRPFWTLPEIKAVHVTTERERIGVNWRTSWAEFERSSLEYMLMRWLDRKDGMGAVRVLRM